jgi:hypothetical protein
MGLRMGKLECKFPLPKPGLAMSSYDCLAISSLSRTLGEY